MSESSRRCYVIKDYEASNGDPFSVQAHEVFHVSEKVDFWSGNPDWVWIWCTDQRGKSGWVPKSRVHIDSDGSSGTITSAYSALELTVVAGDVLTMAEEECGWLWCVNEHKECGWVPLENVEYLPRSRASKEL